jgi:HAD superfamily hydrolase (TIGR01549 family)
MIRAPAVVEKNRKNVARPRERSRVKKLKGIVFDFDGTLADSLSTGLKAFDFAIAKIGEAARSPDEIKKYFGLGADRMLIRLLNDEKKGLAAFQYYKEYQREHASAQLHAGITELLEQIAIEKIPLGIVTGRHSEDLHFFMEQHQLYPRFATVICDDHLQNSKPAPDGILLAVEKMHLRPDEIIYVGDSLGDMEAAHKAGSFGVAVLWDQMASREQFESSPSEYHPDFYATHPQEILEIFHCYSS